ncbi:MAG TPA: RagB/SusD family nutrient uptake outer membrane protein [Parasegetibacter sp.]
MKKNNYKNKASLIVLLAMVVLILPACNKFLDTFPRGISVAKTASDFRKFMDDVDNQRYQYSLSQATGYVDIVSDDVYADSTKWLTWTTTRLHVKQLYAFESDVWVYEALADDINWKNQYYIVSLMGTMLTELKKVTDNPAAKAQMMAEARLHRAYAYLNLVNIYAVHYDPATAATDLGVPMYDDASVMPPLDRKPVQVVYDYIIKELTESIPDLPDEYGQYSHRPSKAAAYAILARTYLYMGNYEEALKYADKALAINNFLHDYNTLYVDFDHTSKLIGMSRTVDKEVYLHKTTTKGVLLNNYMILDSTTFNQLYPNYEETSATTVNNHDLRRTLKFTGINTSGKITGKTVTYSKTYNTWYKTDGSNSSAADNIHLGTPEMYMVRAECNARLGNLQKALDDVNLIRMKRFKTGTYTNKTLADFGSNQQNILNEVLLERRRELYGMELRTYDIKRLKLPVTHTLNSRVLTLQPGDPKLVWPILPAYIEMNPEIQQNTR